MERIEVNITTGESVVIKLTDEELSASKEAAEFESLNNKIAAIHSRLSQIDMDALRPLRAVLVGTATKFDHDKLAALEEESAALRAELAGL